MKYSIKLLTPFILAATLSACGAVDRVTNIGKAPDLAPIEDPRTEEKFRTVQLPMPRPEPVIHQANSLWRPGARAFFRDQRAAQVGDILTVIVAIQDEAQLNNTTTRNRTATEDADATQLFGLQGNFANFLPDAVDPASLLSVGNTSITVWVRSIAMRPSIFRSQHWLSTFCQTATLSSPGVRRFV